MSRFPKILLDRLWHSTSIDRFEGILKDGAIRPEPDIPDSARWCASKGPKHYPFVRTLGGVSLFDFSDFNPTEYGKRYSASWHSFVPDSYGGGNSVWVEVNRQLVQGSLIEGKDLVSKWKTEEAYGHNIMPIIEVAHIGPVHVTCFARVLFYQAGEWNELTKEQLCRYPLVSAPAPLTLGISRF